MITRTCFAIALAGTAIALAPAASLAQDYPDNSVVLVVPFSAGGGTDGTARIFGSALSEELGTDVVVKNTTGAQGTIGANEVATANPDGYTLGYLPVGPVTTQPHLRNTPYDLSSWTYICGVSTSPIVLTVTQDSPYNSVDDVVAAATDAPGDLFWAAGAGSVPHLSLLGFQSASDVEISHLPVGDAAAGVRELMSGSVDFYADSSNIVPRFELKPLVVFSDERLPELPDVPTFEEAGYSGEYAIWNGIFAPASLDENAKEALSTACANVVENEDFNANMEQVQAPVTYKDSEDFEAFVHQQYEQFGELLEEVEL